MTELTLVTVNGIVQACSSGRAKVKFLFFKAHHPSTEKPKALVGFKPRTDPELGTGDSHSTMYQYMVLHGHPAALICLMATTDMYYSGYHGYVTCAAAVW